MRNLEEDVANHLQTEGIGTVSVDIFKGVIRPESQFVPADAVFVLATGGRQGERVHSNLRELRFPTVQIMVRSTSFENGVLRARDILNVMEGALISGYFDTRSLQSTPVFIEQDENSHYFWSQNHELKWESGTII